MFGGSRYKNHQNKNGFILLLLKKIDVENGKKVVFFLVLLVKLGRHINILYFILTRQYNAVKMF
mgnify:CR=1 FL=1